MPIRTVKKYYDRGSIKDVLNGESYEPPTQEELRLKKLYEQSELTDDRQLKDALGFIVMPQAGNRSAFPITVYQHREYINILSKKMADKIEKTKQELDDCFNQDIKKSSPVRMACFKQELSKHAILSNGEVIIKVASASIPIKCKRSFRRAR